MARSPSKAPQKESPDLVQEVGASGIEALTDRINRYANAKNAALEVADFMRSREGVHDKLTHRVTHCGDYLLFRDYFTINEVKLHAASFCMKHLLCPLCAIRRGAKAMQAYLPKFEHITQQNPALRPYLVTLTVKDGPDLAERFSHLQKAQRELWMRKHRGRGSVLHGVVAAVWSYEVKRGEGSGEWHPHLHAVMMAENPPDRFSLSAEWENITGDSRIVDVRQISQEDPASGFLEVFKYAVKFSAQEPADTWHCFEVLSGRRLIGSAGLFRGVEIPDALTDEPLDGLPFVERLFAFLGGKYRPTAHGNAPSSP